MNDLLCPTAEQRQNCARHTKHRRHDDDDGLGMPKPLKPHDRKTGNSERKEMNHAGDAGRSTRHPKRTTNDSQLRRGTLVTIPDPPVLLPDTPAWIVRWSGHDTDFVSGAAQGLREFPGVLAYSGGLGREIQAVYENAHQADLNVSSACPSIPHCWQQFWPAPGSLRPKAVHTSMNKFPLFFDIVQSTTGEYIVRRFGSFSAPFF